MALQLGVPTIASRFAGITQVIQSGVNGFLIDLNPQTMAQDLTESLLNLKQNTKLKEIISQNAKASFEFFTPTVYGKNLLMLYQDVLGKMKR